MVIIKFLILVGSFAAILSCSDSYAKSTESQDAPQIAKNDPPHPPAAHAPPPASRAPAVHTPPPAPRAPAVHMPPPASRAPVVHAPPPRVQMHTPVHQAPVIHAPVPQVHIHSVPQTPARVQTPQTPTPSAPRSHRFGSRPSQGTRSLQSQKVPLQAPRKHHLLGAQPSQGSGNVQTQRVPTYSNIPSFTGYSNRSNRLGSPRTQYRTSGVGTFASPRVSTQRGLLPSIRTQRGNAFRPWVRGLSTPTRQGSFASTLTSNRVLGGQAASPLTSTRVRGGRSLSLIASTRIRGGVFMSPFTSARLRQGFLGTFGARDFKRRDFFRQGFHRNFFFNFFPLLVVPYYIDFTEPYYADYLEPYYPGFIEPYCSDYMDPYLAQQFCYPEGPYFFEKPDYIEFYNSTNQGFYPPYLSEGYPPSQPENYLPFTLSPNQQPSVEMQELEALLQSVLQSMKIFDIPQFYNKPELSILNPTE